MPPALHPTLFAGSHICFRTTPPVRIKHIGVQYARNRSKALTRRAQFIVEDFSSFKEQKQKIESPRFEAAGLTWHLNVYPLGNSKLVRAGMLTASRPSSCPGAARRSAACAGRSLVCSQRFRVVAEHVGSVPGARRNA